MLYQRVSESLTDTKLEGALLVNMTGVRDEAHHFRQIRNMNIGRSVKCKKDETPFRVSGMDCVVAFGFLKSGNDSKVQLKRSQHVFGRVLFPSN